MGKYSTISVLNRQGEEVDFRQKRYDLKECIDKLGPEDAKAIAYFKNLANETGMPYQKLINLYLSDCARSHRKLSMKWE